MSWKFLRLLVGYVNGLEKGQSLSSLSLHGPRGYPKDDSFCRVLHPDCLHGETIDIIMK